MKLEFDVKGLQETIDFLDKGKNLVSTDKISEVLEAIGKEGSEEAQKRYAFAETDGNEVPDVKYEVIGNELNITAYGEDVAFIEFGTGITKEEHPLQYEVEGIVPHGQYGYGQGANIFGWWHGGTKHMGIDAQRCLYDTGKWLEQEIPKKFNEVMK